MSGGNPDRVHPRTIDIIEEEGLARALNCVGRVLAGTGRGKHGIRKWARFRSREHERKAIRHLCTEGLDEGGSNEPHAANGVARALFLLALILRKMEEAKK